MRKSRSTTVYYLPCKPASVYVNVTDACLNRCLFCIKRHGTVFFGSDLAIHGKPPQPGEITRALFGLDAWPAIREVVFCGMGEPLLRYDCVLSVCGSVREARPKVSVRVDTSGLFWARDQRLDVLNCCDTLSVSLNAETAEKYERMCCPLIPNAYGVLLDFLAAVRQAQEKGNHRRRFPQVRLSVVDTSELAYLPASGCAELNGAEFPVPDVVACRRIAEGYGWPLVVKRLFRDSQEEHWKDTQVRDRCLRGIAPQACADCSYRH